ncbi:hypothetical protein G647_02825 [Cladophialophora carrionii CBS 160.54]|uniref:Uncharacterized protein n=1 Tax=Cladophialophora carrionii CBS 160.54 TaxID=1279043 RepID=V9DIA1_9EURO|nr:uncharacterized protein G647_02825 [Cladophialophora carrionii CBS 160.54]ETI26048.1 hypothetical protein G647_02825 [Cladophialophora carrionii CBS 160.54]
MENEPPTCVSDAELDSLADLCLCFNNKNNREVIKKELEDRLTEACSSYESFQNLKTQFTEFRRSLCNKLSIEDNCSDHQISREVQKSIDNASRKDQQIRELEADLASEKSKMMRANSAIEGHQNKNRMLENRIQELEAELQGSTTQSEELQESLQLSKADLQHREAELHELKSKIADRESSNVELNLSIGNLQTQLRDNEALETTLRLE